MPQPQSAAQWLAIGQALLAQLRSQYGLAEGAHTLAVGWTTVPGLEAQRFVGASRALRETALLPSPTAHLQAPRSNAQFLDHAEQDVANAFIDAVAAARLREAQLEGQALRIFVSHARGPCSACAQGVHERQVEPGVLSALSRRYPGLTVVVAWSAGGALRHLMLQDGVRLH
ncbi:MAG: hypothetical protein KF683_11260 [Rubrivivax sp.]|nr:hypothetical protein [Rubrivivax sp.]